MARGTPDSPLEETMFESWFEGTPSVRPQGWGSPAVASGRTIRKRGPRLLGAKAGEEEAVRQ